MLWFFVLQCTSGFVGLLLCKNTCIFVTAAVSFSFFVEVSDEKIGSHFRCSIVDLLQTCYPALTEESITNEIVLSQNLDRILKALTCVERSVGELFL